MAFANYDDDPYGDPYGYGGEPGPPPGTNSLLPSQNPANNNGGYNPGVAQPQQPSDGGDGDKGGGGGDSFNWDSYKLPAVPTFNPTMFKAPTYSDAMNEPGYKFRLDTGTDALERSAAARGVLRTGGTLKDIVGYGQNFASQEYNNVFNRALQGYNAQYTAQHDMFSPQMARYQQEAMMMRDRALAEFNYTHQPKGGGQVDDPISDYGGPPAYPQDDPYHYDSQYQRY